MTLALKIRGIYTTALTSFFLGKGISIAFPSEETAQRFLRREQAEFLEHADGEISDFEGKPVLDIIGKGNKPRLVSCPEALARNLFTYARHKGLGSQDRFFPFNRTRGWQIIKQAAKKAEFEKRVFPHLLRHSDAIERLKQTGNPKALQYHLGHSSISMVMRYLSTLTQEDSLRIQQKVEFKEKNFGRVK